MKKIIIISVLLIASGILFFAFSPGEKTTVNYDTHTASKGTISKTITATGTIEPIIQVEVGTQVSGTIDRIYVDYNDIVTKGQLIAMLDRTVLESELASQTANMKSNQNEYEYQKKNYERASTLYSKKLTSDSEFETSEYQYHKAKQAYDKSRSDLVKAKTNLSYTMIYSPIDGVVLSRAVDEGQTVAATFNTPTLFTIAKDLKKMQVIANVDEADIGQVTEGLKVIFSVDAFPDEEFEGSVTQVRLQPTTTSNVVTYEVVVEAPNPDLKLKPGLTANITVYTLQKDNVILIPLKALRFHPTDPEVLAAVKRENPKKGEKTIWLEKTTFPTPLNIQTGVSDGIYVEVTQGIQAGDKIITGIHQDKEAKEAKKGGSPFMPAGMGGKPH